MNPLRKNFIYRHLASIKTSIYLLSILGGFFLIGTVFPQGVDPEKYAAAGGKFLFGAHYLGFLNIFETPLFFTTALLLALNTAVCTFDRVAAVKSTARKGDAEGGVPPGYEVPRDRDIPGIADDLASSLKKRGYRLKGKDHAGNTHALVFHKGVNHTVTSILFHAGIALCLLLFFYTHFLAYENFLTIYPGETKDVELPDDKSAPFQLKLNEFATIYEDNPTIQFPGEAHLKMAAIISKPGLMAGFELPEGAIAVSDWVSDISVLSEEEEVLRKKIEVNIPLRHGGFTFYQMGYDQEVELAIRGKRATLFPGKPFEVTGKENITTSPVKHGTLNKLDGTKEEITPFVTIYELKGAGGRDTREKIGEVSLGEKITIDGATYSFINFKEGSVLSYRVDPSVHTLYYLSFIIIVLITLRLYFRESRLRVWFRERENGYHFSYSLRTRGGVFPRPDEPENVKEGFVEAGLPYR